MYLSKNDSKRRLKEAEDARANRLEIVDALSRGTISKRDLFKWGIFTVTGGLLAKNGLSPFAQSAYAQVPTGTPPSPLFGAKKFTHPMHRQELQKPIPLIRQPNGDAAWQTAQAGIEAPAKNYSYHTDYDNSGRMGYRNPVTGIGPMEGTSAGAAIRAPAMGGILSEGRLPDVDRPVPGGHPILR